MFITPLTQMQPMIIEDMTKVAGVTGTQVPFSSVFESAVKNVQETDAIAKQDTYKMMLGEMDDLHTVQINKEKAFAAVQLLMQVRNKALDAYNEVMRMGV
ncbi:MAG: flagellar hook-basal body complex protein FliE [Oscillospiraceae bacterium]